MLTLLLVGACSSKPDKETLRQFKTLITKDGVKRFELALPRPNVNTELSRTNSDRPRNPYRNEWPEKQIKRRVESVMTTFNYCREGFILLGRHAGETARKIRGECKEPATQNDMQQFKNSIPKW